MALQKIKLSVYSLILSIGTPCILIAYGQIRKAQRPELACSGKPNCVDLRGLNELPLLIGLWIVLDVIALGLAIYAYKQNETLAKVAIAVAVVLPVVVLVVSALVNN